MTHAPLDPATTPAGATSPGGETHERDWAALELEILGDLARVGTSIAEEMSQGYRATAAVLPAGSPARVKADREVGLAFMRISRAVRLTMAMFGRARQAREALLNGTAAPAVPDMPGRPQSSAEAEQRAVEAIDRLFARALDGDLDDEEDLFDDLDDEEDLFDDLYDGPDPADAPDRPDRESLTEFADFGFSLDRCHPGEVIARIYRDLGLPPDPVRWPQAWPAPQAPQAPRASQASQAGVPGKGEAVAEASGPVGIPDRPAAPAPSDPSSSDPRPEPPALPPAAGPAPSADPPARPRGPPEDSS